jgi:phenylacetate-coenzyme A ligase PaaK-like adenylate-forming protein
MSKFSQIQSDAEFNSRAIELFRKQKDSCEIYNQYLRLIRQHDKPIQHWSEIPFLPIEFFKSHRVTTGDFEEQAIFTSSGTTGQTTSKHFVKDLSIYEESFCKGFEYFYGNPEEWTVLALLPSYLERSGSSLVYMADHFIKRSHSEHSGFFLHNHQDLFSVLNRSREAKQKILLIGVTYALLDFADQFEVRVPDLVVMETGGMKGRREEMTRDEVHTELKKCFEVNAIHSEYGMTELMSQAYSKGNGIFECPPWMKVAAREVTDPFNVSTAGSGALNIIDLANEDSCAFIATQDLCKIQSDGRFEVLGRFDHAEVRGCNLMVV